MRQVRIVTWLTVPFGFVAAHVVAFVASHPDQPGEALTQACHGRVQPAVVAATIGLWAATLAGSAWSGWHRDPRPMRFAPLAVRMVALFALVEIAEHLVDRSTEVAGGEPAVWLGLASQLLVAAGIVWLSGITYEVGAKLSGICQPAHPPTADEASAVVPWSKPNGLIGGRPPARAPPPAAFI